SIIFFFNDTATTEIYTLSLHDALPILDKMDFAAQIIVARKKEQIFTGKHKGSPDLFYDDLVSRLFANHLHLATNNTITFARRGSKARSPWWKCLVFSNDENVIRHEILEQVEQVEHVRTPEAVVGRITRFPGPEQPQ